jgi:hypothetical protein
LGLLIS